MRHLFTFILQRRTIRPLFIYLESVGATMEEKSIPVCLFIGDDVTVKRLCNELLVDDVGYARYKKYIGRVASFYEAAMLIEWLRQRNSERYRFFVSVTETSIEQSKKEILADRYKDEGAHYFSPMYRSGVVWKNFLYVEEGLFVWEIASLMGSWKGDDPRKSVDVSLEWFASIKNASGIHDVYTYNSSVADYVRGRVSLFERTVQLQRAFLRKFYTEK